MSVSNVDDAKTIIDDLVKRGVAYAVGLYSFLHSVSEWRSSNVRATLEPAFGANEAERVYSELERAFKNINLYVRVRVGDREEYLVDYLRKYILEEHVTKVILEEVEKRFNQMPEGEKRILSITCAIIDKLEGKDYPELYISRNSEGFLVVGVSDSDYFPTIVSSVLGFDVPNIRALFYKYLLGFNDMTVARRHWYLSIKIYPFAITYVKKLASYAPNYIKLPSKSEVESKLHELYERGEFLKLSVIHHAPLTYYINLIFLEHFSGKPREQLCKEIIIEGIMNKCFVNPPVYDYVNKYMKSLYEEALRNLTTVFKEILEKAGYYYSCISDYCIFTKTPAKPIYMWFYPWPLIPSTPYRVEGSKVIVIQGIPSPRILEYLKDRAEDALWLFLEGKRVAIASNTYRGEDHSELLKALGSYFSVEFIGPVSEDLTKKPGAIQPQLITTTRPEVLESIVASVLRDLGLNVQTNVKLPAKGGEIEVDVWATKNVGGLPFRVYVSCKNWNRDVDRQVIDQEFGRVLQLDQLPHLRILVVRSLTEPAKKAALDDGFFVIELGEKATTANSQEIYSTIYGKLRDLFIGIAPDKIRKIIDSLENIIGDLEELVKPRL
jgi:hypothetical protein